MHARPCIFVISDPRKSFMQKRASLLESPYLVLLYGPDFTNGKQEFRENFALSEAMKSKRTIVAISHCNIYTPSDHEPWHYGGGFCGQI